VVLPEILTSALEGALPKKFIVLPQMAVDLLLALFLRKIYLSIRNQQIE